MPRRSLVLGELEAAILGVLWDRGEATVADVVEALREARERHYNTCSTVLGRLARRGLVASEKRGRTLVFRPTVSREELGNQYLDRLRQHLFGGSSGRLISALLGSERPDDEQRRRIAELVREIEQEAGDA